MIVVSEWRVKLALCILNRPQFIFIFEIKGYGSTNFVVAEPNYIIVSFVVADSAEFECTLVWTRLEHFIQAFKNCFRLFVRCIVCHLEKLILLCLWIQFNYEDFLICCVYQQTYRLLVIPSEIFTLMAKVLNRDPIMMLMRALTTATRRFIVLHHDEGTTFKPSITCWYLF